MLSSVVWWQRDEAIFATRRGNSTLVEAPHTFDKPKNDDALVVEDATPDVGSPLWWS